MSDDTPDLPDISALEEEVKAHEVHLLEFVIDCTQKGDRMAVDPYWDRELLRRLIRRRIRLMSHLVEQCNELDALVSTSAKGTDGGSE